MKLTNSEISSLCMELALLVHAGMNIGDGLHTLAEETDGSLREGLAAAAGQVEQGTPLSRTLEDGELLPREVCRLIRVGERTGRTEEALRALSDSYDAKERLEQRLRSALLYPSVLLVMMLIVIGVLLIRVLPVFNSVFESLGGELTGLAGGLLQLGRALDTALPVLLVLLAAAAVFLTAFAASRGVRERIARLWKRRRGERGIARKTADAEFTRALAMALRSGLPVGEALGLAEDFHADNPAVLRRCRDARSRLEQGEDLAGALEKAGVLPASYCRMLALGIRSGTGDSVMQEIARRTQDDSESAVEQAAGRVEPTLVIVTSVLVGAILLSVMLPLMNILAAVG
ncbi:MAG: type II secretion system F family protein [Oscillibacter sp.]|jgi:type IV pilus assembly protein PilC|nr:type II secretion system F family protein [Oscillibacter sp.]